MMKKAQQSASSGRLGGGRDDYQARQSSYSMSPNDRMHLFMSASKQVAASTDGTLENVES
jgi:hypothetical protein